MNSIGQMLNLPSFREWLEESLLHSVVGYANDPQQCPIAQYLRDCNHDVAIVEIGSKEIAVELYGGKIEVAPSPEWAQEFIVRIDGDGSEWEVSREMALDYVDRVAFYLPRPR